MSSGARAAGKKAYRSGQRNIPPKNGELYERWGPRWEDEWLAGWKEAERAHLLEQRKSQDYELGM